MRAQIELLFLGLLDSLVRKTSAVTARPYSSKATRDVPVLFMICNFSEHPGNWGQVLIVLCDF